ncbi:MAG: exosortase U [Planctomycetota bacterium]|nr:exosortase U [Planctomycetota bacterium]
MLAAVSALLTSGAWLLKAFGWRQAFAWLPPWMILWILIPPPNSLDIKSINWLQRVTASAASLCLDVFDYDHLMTGVILELPNAKFFVDEACSGVHSLLALVAATCLFIVWAKRPAISAIGLLLAAVWWAGFGNISRIVIITVAYKQWDIDLATGWAHDAVGLVTFAISFGMLLATDRLLFAIFAPVDDADDNRICRVWNRWIAGNWFPLDGLDAADSNDPSLRRTRTPRKFPLTTWCFAFAVAIFGGLQFAVMALHPELDTGGHEKSYLAIYEQLDAETLPDNANNWKRLKYKVEHRDWDNTLGKCSQIWNYASEKGQAHVALDYPFVGDHDLSICYSNHGWQVARETRYATTPDGADNPYVEVQLKNATGDNAVLFYSLFDEQGHAMTPPTGQFWRDLIYRVERSPLITIAQNRGIVSRGRRVRSYQFQMFLPTDRALPDEDRMEVRDQFLGYRAAVLRDFLSTRDSMNRVEVEP